MTAETIFGLSKKQFDLLGIDSADYRFYFIYFVGSLTEFLVKTVESKNWLMLWNKRSKRFPSRHRCIFRHLIGVVRIARSYPAHGKFFSIEISGKLERDQLVHSYQSIARILPNPLVIQSTLDGNIQLYWFLKKSWPEEIIRKAFAARLAKHGLRPRKGILETFPGTSRYFRLPLGQGSLILDDIDLSDKCLSLKGSIRHLRRIKPNGEWVLGLPVKKVNRGTSTPSNELHAKFLDEVHQLYIKRLSDISALTGGLESSIVEFGTRLQRESLLIQACYEEGSTEVEAFSRISSWYGSIWHFSKDERESEDQMLSELKTNIHGFYEKRRKFETEIRVAVPVDAIKRILAVFENRESQWGRDVYNRQRFMFHLIQLFISRKTTTLSIPSYFFAELDGAHFMTSTNYRDGWIRSGALTIVPSEKNSGRLSRSYKLEWKLEAVESVNSFETSLFQPQFSSVLNRYTKAMRREIDKRYESVVLIRRNINIDGLS